MKTVITQTNGVTTVELTGYLDFESARPLADSINKLYESDESIRLVISLQGLEFVGSSGISSFVKTMKHFNNQKIKPSYCGVKTEFQRLFRLFEDAEAFAIYENKDEAKEAALRRYNDWQARQIRSKATH